MIWIHEITGAVSTIKSPIITPPRCTLVDYSRDKSMERLMIVRRIILFKYCFIRVVNFDYISDNPDSCSRVPV